MRIGSRGLNLIKRYETLRMDAYKPTPNDVWTIGYGHTRGVKPGDSITEAQADAYLLEDVASSERAVDNINVPLTQAQYDALVSLVFNCGPGAVNASSTVGRNLRRRNYYLAYRGFCLWTKQAGQDLRGLARRRAEEMLLFMEDRF